MSITKGIEIINNDGYTIIDETYSNYITYESGTLSVASSLENGTLGTIWFFEIAIPNTPGTLVFIRPAVNTDDAYWLLSGGSPGTTLRIGTTSNAASIKYKILADSSIITTMNEFGFVVYKEDGSVAFSSLQEHPTLVSLVSHDNLTNSNVTLSNSTKERYICVSSSPLIGYIDASDTVPNYYIGNIYLQIWFTTNIDISFTSDYAAYQSQFTSGTLTGSLAGVTGTQYYLILEK